MGDPALLLQLFAALVLAVVAAAFLYAAAVTRNGWAPAGWGLALILEAARRITLIFAPSFLTDAPVPPDTVRFLILCIIFIAAAASHRSHAVPWIGGALAVSASAAVYSAYRPDLVMLFIPLILLCAGLATWRWRRPAMLLSALALFGWSGVLGTQMVKDLQAFNDIATDASTALLAMLAGLAFLIDHIARNWEPTPALVAPASSRAAQKTQARARALENSTEGMIWETDADLNFLAAPSWLKAMGRGVGNGLGNLRNVAPSCESDTPRRSTVVAVEAGEPFAGIIVRVPDPGAVEGEEPTRIRISGRPILDTKDRLLGYRGTLRDVTADLSVERRAEENAQMLRATLAGMAEGLIAVDRDLKILLINDALKRFLDLTMNEDPQGHSFADVLLFLAKRGDLGPDAPEAAVKAFIDRLNQTARPDEPAFEWELPDGRTCLVSCDPLPEGGLVATFTDVTEQQNALRVMAAARDTAERGNKAKTEFLARMSHELRTPLNSIIGFAGLIRDEAAGPLGAEDYRDYANNIGASGEVLLSQINAILDVARLEAGSIALTEGIIDLRATLETVITAAAAFAAGNEITVSHYLASDLPAMRADEYRLTQVFGHILDNAVKFSPSGSQVMVRALADPFEGVTISISDEGIGMTDEQVNRALEPFAQADSALDRQFEGTGLGLSMAKGLIDLHGGSIAIASIPDNGTTVSIRLPPERMVTEF